MLEDRCVPAGTGSIGGSVFLNSLTNGLPGATVSLTGTPTTGAAIPVNLDAVTDGAGSFSFTGLESGNYQLSAGPFVGILGSVSIGSVRASASVSVTSPVALAGGASVQSNVVIQGGFDPTLITMSHFLTTSADADFPFNGATGNGAGNDAPFVSLAIANQTLTPANPTTTIDLAGRFSDPNITNSAVTMNISANGVSQQINLELLDTVTPQTVANFFNYVNAGSYDSSFFHRETTVAKDGIAVLQGGGGKITDGVGPSVITPVLATIPDEIDVSNTKGTLAMANTGSANTASNQFFFNVTDNTSLDPRFTVFAEVADASSQTVLDTLGVTPTQDLSNHTANISASPTGATESGNTVTIATTTAHQFTVGRSVTITGVGVLAYNGTFIIDSVPSPTTFTYTHPTAGLLASGGGTANVTTAFATGSPSLLLNSMPLFGAAVSDFPTDASRYVVINNIVTTRRDEFLTYSIVSNRNPAAVTASLVNEQLTFTRVAAGVADIVVQATDRFGASVTMTIRVTST